MKTKKKVKDRAFLCHELTCVGHFEMGCEVLVMARNRLRVHETWAMDQFGLSCDELDLEDGNYVYDDGEKRVTLDVTQEIEDPAEIQVLRKYLPVCP